MRRGRPSSIPRSEFGQRLYEAREQAGLSQAELAQKMNVLQRTVAYWERRPVSLRPDQMTQLAKILGVAPGLLLGHDEPAKPKRGPKSRLERQFEAVSKLPPSEQQLVSKLLERFISGKAA